MNAQILGVHLASALAHAMPLPVAYAIARGVGRLTFLAWPGGRRRILANTRIVLGGQADERRVRQVGGDSLANYCCYVVDFLRFSSLTSERVRQMMDAPPELEGIIARRPDDKRGVVFVSLHLGNWDVAGAWLATFRPIHVIAETLPLNDFIQGTRQHLNLDVWPMEKLPLKLFKALKQGEAVAILIDRPETAASGVPVIFFGRQTWLPGGPATLALRSGARIITGAAIRVGPARYRGMFDDTIDYQPTGDIEADAQVLTQAIVTSIERYITACPEQWYMFRSMWPAD